jgi:uncharacterized membrane protein
VTLQPITGGLLMWMSSTGITEGWLLTSLVLYAVAGAFWVPVILHAGRDARPCAGGGCKRRAAAPRYFTLFRRWFLFGIPGFGSVMAILWLMIAKPF